MYNYGHGVGKNKSTAAEWYRQAAEQGHAYAQFYLGIIYASGNCDNQNQSTAAEWYRKATKQGHAYAQRNLYRCINTVFV